MRFDTPILFESIQPGAYDAQTGNRKDGRTVRFQRYGSVTNAGAEQLNLGSSSAAYVSAAQIVEGALTVRIHGWITHPFDQMVIDGKTYRPVFHRRLRRMETYIVREVQDG